MKKVFSIMIMLVLLFNLCIFTVNASSAPYVTFQFKDTSEWVKWINNADYTEIERLNQPNYTNRMLVEVPRTAGYILVPKWNGKNLSEINRDESYSISTFPATLFDNKEIRFLGWYSFDAQADNTLFLLRIFPIPSGTDNPMDYLDIFHNENRENYVKIFEHYAVVITADKPVPEGFYSKFTFDKVQLTDTDKVVETYDFSGSTLIRNNETWWIWLVSGIGAVIIILGIASTVVKIKHKNVKS